MAILRRQQNASSAGTLIWCASSEMKHGFPVKVVLSKRAYGQIRDLVTDTGNRFEVGGLLLGYKCFARYHVVAATVPSETAERSQVSFVLDGDWHTARAFELMQEFQHKPSILGVWHSHICDVDVFSEQDRQSNEQLAICFHGALSMIAIWTASIQNLGLTAYFISPGRKERLCRVIVN